MSVHAVHLRNRALRWLKRGEHPKVTTSWTVRDEIIHQMVTDRVWMTAKSEEGAGAVLCYGIVVIPQKGHSDTLVVREENGSDERL